jgi:hypothetical protein
MRKYGICPGITADKRDALPAISGSVRGTLEG